jgi:hypothetical protein
LPRFIRSFETIKRDPGVKATAEILARVAEEQYQCTSLADALTSFALKRYRQETDFLSQTLSALRSAYFPDLELGSLIFLLSLLTNKIDWMKINTMEVLCILIPEIEMRKPEIASKGPDLISPLLRLLQTEFCPQALRVLDFVINLNMTNAPTPSEKQHIRMSMAGSHSTRGYKKQFEKTQSLYGIPEESGWSIPMPAHHSHLTRANVHAVFYTCGNLEGADAPETATPKIEFRADEFPFSPLSDYRTATMTSEDTRGEGHIGDLVMKLDSLDDFFDDDDDDGDNETLTDLPNFTSSHYHPNGSYTNNTLNTRENLYDQQTAPILLKSLTRNASVTSFQSGFSTDHVKLSPARDPGVMTPGAFSSFTSTPTASGPTSAPRPGLHARSVTSPSAPNQTQRVSPSLSTTALDEIGESFSDDDIRLTPADRTFSLENMAKPVTHSTGSRIRNGMRRLAGGGGDGKEGTKTREAIKQALQKSPQVPKVPDIYLHNPKSSDL